MAKSKRERRVSVASTWGFPAFRPSFPSTAADKIPLGHHTSRFLLSDKEQYWREKAVAADPSQEQG